MGTIYRPTTLSPRNVSLDMSVNQTFTCVIDGQRVTGYDINIYDNSNDSLIYTASESFSVNDYLYNKDTLHISVPNTSGCSNGNEYKWSVKYYNVSESVTSEQVIFYSASTPSFTISVPATISNQSYDFIGTYSQSENTPIYYWYYELYDSLGRLINKTDKAFSNRINYTFDGLFNGESYMIKGYLESQDGMKVSTIDYTFSVSYSEGSVDATPNIRLLERASSPLLSLVIAAEAEGGYSFVENFLVDGNYGVSMENGTIIYYEANTFDTYTLRVAVVLDWDFNGAIIKLENTETDDFLEIGYNQLAESFYQNKSGTISLIEELYPVVGKVYSIFVRPNDVVIKEDIYQDAQYTTSDGDEFFVSNGDFLFVQYEE